MALTEHSALRADYTARITSGALDEDPAQRRLVAKLAGLEARLKDHRLARKGSALGWLFGAKRREPLKGLYIWGGVGRGKSLLM
ncbi:MAG: AFG1/ZapE family ATPase, partial [Pseudomonadota bacterium]